ncbi:cell division protein FtsL [uncultured Adlercreutzia sp.]|uniref:cell division protein FtsL n=1 Tax=uncultured Adlercreutzia sp. TaxID=875803 RepID=UPI0025F3B0AE|nr:cell division protein FtsL [uncultured Adlercreutzia sp.]MCI9261957.1 cell division protein FtsL [Eggerthellaceae bacterium]
MSASSYYRASSYGRSSAAAPSRTAARSARSSAASYRGARYVPTATAEVLPDFNPEPRIAVVPGQGRRAESAGLSEGVLMAAKVLAAVAVALALIAIVRVTIASASAACALETREISQNIESARSEGNDLEVAQSVLSNPARIRAQAESMGMAAPTAEFTDQIILDDDVVATDEAGNLSLSASAAVVASQGAAA